MVMLQDRADAGAAETPLALLKPHWRLVLAAFLGWFLDAFGQVTLLLVLPELGKPKVSGSPTRSCCSWG